MWFDSLIPDSFFISGFALFFLLLVYLPLILWLIIKLWRAISIRKSVRIGVISLVILIIAAVPLGDVYIGSLKLENLCESEGGMHIYKTVEVDGFLSRYLVFNKVIDGYSYIESEHGTKFYKVINVNEENIFEKIEKPISRYILDYERNVLNPTMAKTRHFIEDKNTGSILGEKINYVYYGGWLDRFLFLSWIDYKPMTCKLAHFKTNEFISKILIPAQLTTNGDAL